MNRLMHSVTLDFDWHPSLISSVAQGLLRPLLPVFFFMCPKQLLHIQLYSHDTQLETCNFCHFQQPPGTRNQNPVGSGSIASTQHQVSFFLHGNASQKMPNFQRHTHRSIHPGRRSPSSAKTGEPAPPRRRVCNEMHFLFKTTVDKASSAVQ